MFSTATISEILECLESKTTSELKTIFFKHNLSDIAVGGSKTEKLLSVSKHIYKFQDNKQDMDNIRVLDLLDYSIGYLSSIINSYGNNSYSCSKKYVEEELDELNKKLEKINNFLIKDGFSISNGKIIRTIPSVVNIQEREDLLFALLDKHNFDIPKGHIDQAIHNFTDGNWLPVIHNYVVLLKAYLI